MVQSGITRPLNGGVYLSITRVYVPILYLAQQAWKVPVPQQSKRGFQTYLVWSKGIF